MAVSYGCRPSALFGLDEYDNPILELQFDETVWMYGDAVENLLSQTQQKGGKIEHKFSLSEALSKAAGEKIKKESLSTVMLSQGLDDLIL